MSYWHLQLKNLDEIIVREHKLPFRWNGGELQLLHLEGTIEDRGSWHFTSYGDETQSKESFICNLESKTGSLAVTADVGGIRIRQPPLDPRTDKGSYFDLVYSLPSEKYITLLRSGDRLEFTEHDVVLDITLVFVPDEDAEVEVKSSAIKAEVDEEELDPDEEDLDETNGESNGYAEHHTKNETQDTQNPYSTGREQLPGSPTSTPKAARTQDADQDHSQVVQETPGQRVRKLQQHSSTLSGVPDSLPINISRYSSTLEPGGDSKHSRGTFRGTEVAETQSQPQSATVSGARRHDQDILRTSQSGVREEEDHTLVGTSTSDKKVTPINEDVQATTGAEANPEYSQDDKEHDDPLVPETGQLAMLSAPTSQSGSDTIRVGIPDRLRVEDKDNESGGEAELAGAIEAANTPETRVRGTKRKRGTNVGPVTASRTSSIKRAKRTEAELLVLESGTINSTAPGATPSHTLRRTSPRVQISQHDASPSPTAIDGVPQRLLLPSESKVPQRKPLMAFLRRERVTEAKDAKPSSFDIYCVGDGKAELKTTAKLLTSLVHGKTIVTDEWLEESFKTKRLLNSSAFLPEGLQNRKKGLKVFEDMTIYCSAKLRTDYKKGWDDIHAIMEQAGATVVSCAPSKIPKSSKVDLYLGAEKGDPHVPELQKLGMQVFQKDLITHSIIVGELVVDEEKFGLPLLATKDSGTPASSMSGNSDKGVDTKKGRSKKK